MNRTIPLLTLGALALVAGCNQDKTIGTTNTTGANTPSDSSRATPSPLDQGGSATDLATTQQVTKALMTDATLPADAKVVKVATVNGVVTLRGQVDNAADSKAIEAKAKLAAPANRIDNQLTVKAPR